MHLTSLTSLLVLAIVACSLPLEVSAIGEKASCQFTTPAMHSFDFSSVDTNNGAAWSAKDASGNAYSWHICSEDQGLKGCTSSAVCQQPASGDAKSCGKLDTQKYSVVGDDNGETVSVLYNDGTQCQDGTPRQTTITLKCGTEPTAIVGQNVAEDPANKCFYLVTMQGKELCASGSKPPKGGNDDSLSGGSIFLIILACSIVLYLIVGVGVKFQKYEARGIDLIPNLDFWRDLPFLCKDGVMFVVDKVKGLFGGSSGTYETVDG